MPSLEAQTAQTIDLTQCEREPIHIPSRIQPHGVLLTLREPEGTILQVSANTLQYFGKSPEELLGKPLETLFDAHEIVAVRERCQHENIDGNPLYLATLTVQGERQRFDSILHRIDGVLVLELEPVTVVSVDDLNYYDIVKKMLPSLQATQTVTELCQIVTQQVRQMCRYDRVMVYQFHEDGHGSVIAEDRRDDLESSLNLHYPEADIPKQARRLLELNPLRLIADVNYTPVDLLPTCNPVTGQPLDMSNCLLRSISPMHIEYLQNMGVGATLGVSLLQDGKLWGLIIGHHYSPHALSYDVRAFCEFLGQVVSMQLSAKAENEDREYRLQMQNVQAQLVASMMQEEVCLNGLHRYSPNLLDFIEVGGAAICMQGESIRLGEAPDDVFLTHLTDWLLTNSETDVLAIDHLSKVFPEALNYKESASGLLAVTLSREQKQYLLWFRPEVTQTVAWGGNPNKSVEFTSDGTARLMPRKSFKVWHEVVQNKSLPWKQVEIEAARNLRHALLGVLLTETNAQQKQQIVQINEQVAQNERLQASLKEREERLDLATESGEMGIWDYDILTNVVAWDERMKRLFGISPDTFPIIYETWSERLHPDDKARTEAELGAAMRDGTKFDTEFRIVQPNGVTRHIKANAIVLKDESQLPMRMVGINYDITERMQAEERLRQAQERLVEAQHLAHIGSWEFDIATGVITWSEELFRILGLDPSQGEPTYTENLALYLPEDAALLDACVNRAITEKAAYELDLRRTVFGEQRWYHAFGNPIVDDQNHLVRLVGTLQDITERKRVEHQLEAAKEWLEEANQHLETTNLQLERRIVQVNEQTIELEINKVEIENANRRLQALAITDGLTGLKNHRAFQEKLAEEFERTQRYNVPMSIILLDVDKFKSYNDSFGHPEGDVVLKTVAQILQEMARDTDYVCRYGGEEFVIILPNTDAQGAREASERFRVAIENQAWTLRPVTASFGVATLQADLTTTLELITHADTAMYTSKKKGRNRVTHYSDLSLMEGIDNLTSAAVEEPRPLIL